MGLIAAEQCWEVERCGIEGSETQKKKNLNRIFRETDMMIVLWWGGWEVRANVPEHWIRLFTAAPNRSCFFSSSKCRSLRTCVCVWTLYADSSFRVPDDIKHFISEHSYLLVRPWWFVDIPENSPPFMWFATAQSWSRKELIISFLNFILSSFIVRIAVIVSTLKEP